MKEVIELSNKKRRKGGKTDKCKIWKEENERL